MSRGRRAAAIVGGVAAVALAAAVVGLGIVGVEQTVTTGTQPQICGATVSLSGSGPTVRLAGETVGPGDRVRLTPLCVVEILSIEDDGLGADEDGGSARVHLRWRLW